MIVLAIDPGYDRVGIAVIEKNKKEILLHSECIETDKQQSINKRVMFIGQQVRKNIEKYTPDAMAIEDLFFAKNTKTALKVSESRGVVIFQAMDAGIPVYEYTPNQIKLAVTGYGKATKLDVNTMVSRLIDIGNDTKLDDEIDAIATGLTFFARYRNNKEI